MQSNATNTGTEGQTNGVEPYKDAAFDAYLTFCALGGMMVSDTGQITGISIDEFCKENNVNRTTLWRWKKEVPGIALMIRQRRDEIVPLSRETAALNRLLLIGMTSLPTDFKETVIERKTSKDGTVTEKIKRVPIGQLHTDQRAAVDALKTYAGHHSKLRLPTQPIEHDVSENFADLFAEVEEANIIEGEVIEPNAGTEANTLRTIPQQN